MMLIINPLKPLYIDESNKYIRLGNFKDFAKEIEFEDDSILYLIELLKKPISKDKLIIKIKNKTHLSEEDIDAAINYLINEGFIMHKNDYDNLINDKYYCRQKLFFSMVNDNIKEWNIDKMPNILILGLGGVGANVTKILNRSGFKKFTLVDCDIVEESNLIRQLPYSKFDIGVLKTEALKSKLDFDCDISIFNKKINSEKDIEDEIKNADFVVSTLDKPSRIIRRIINKLCVEYNKPVIFSGFSEHTAMIGPFIIPHETACLKCIEQMNNEVPMNNVLITPSYGPLCVLISSIVSNEVINYYYNFNRNNLIGKTLMFNMLDYSQEVIEWNKINKCEVCSNDSK